jgi:hypothetical protein
MDASSLDRPLRALTARSATSGARSPATWWRVAALVLAAVVPPLWAADDAPVQSGNAAAAAQSVPVSPAAAPAAAPSAPAAAETTPGSSANAPASEPAAPESAPTPSANAPAAPASAPAAPANAGTPPASEFSDLDSRIQDTKSEVIQLNRDLMVLEEELLFPASTQVAVFVSMDVGNLFDLDSVQVKMDDKNVANYLYTPAEVLALHRGGVQRIYLGNLKAGSHELVAFFTGGGPHRRDYRRATSVKFDKGTDPKYIELRIKDSTGKLQPEFDVRIWPGANSPAPPPSQ